MRLYYFTSERFGLDAIRDRRVKIARIASLNDPFEFLGLRLDRADRKVQRKWKNELNDRFGLICMSTRWSHPLMWGHYADKHKGLCLGFEVQVNEAFKKVDYRLERFTFEELGCQSLADIDEVSMIRLLYSKFEGWEYEREYRGFVRLDEAEPTTGLHFLPFSPTLQLAQVIVGEQASVSRKELAAALGPLGRTVTSFKARAGYTKFEVVENLRAKAWK